MTTIRFSHLYCKMPTAIHRKEEHMTTLIGMDVQDIKNLPAQFLEWDTEYHELNEAGTGLAHYELPKGKVLVLFLYTTSPKYSNCLWTTIRRWTPEKEIYYRALVGKEVEIKIIEGKE